MQARKKPYFAGNTVPVNGESGAILYNRYTDPGEVILDSEKPVNGASFERQEKKRKVKEEPEAVAVPLASAPTPVLNFGGTDPPPAVVPTAGDDIVKEPKLRKKARWTDDQKAAAKEEKIAARKALGLPEKAPAVEKKKKDKTKEETLAIRKLAPEERISGPGNAEEATKIRETLGFVSAPAAAAAAAAAAAPAPAPAPVAAAAGGFAFGFQANGQLNDIAAPDCAPSDDDSSSDEEEEEMKPTTAGVAVPVEKDDDSDDSSSDEDGKAAASDSDDDSSSSSSDSEDSSSSSSSSDDEEEAAKPNATNTPAAPAINNTTPNGTAALVSPLDSEFVPRRVYVGGMPYGFSESQVAEFWEYCGAIESLDLLTFPDTGRFRGIAFITFATEEGYTAALACDGEACEGQTVKVQKWYDVAYVGNIAYEADEDAVRALFEPFGVTKVRLHTDKDTGKPKGFAHVHFKDEPSLDSAMSLDGTQLMGRRIKVGYAQPKKEAPAT
ncbi:hypothetical protein Ndes2526A_g07078 [Nannochloris sp. 'desiccata']